MSIYLHKVKSRWQPGENTVMYFPFVEDQADKIGSATINVTGTKDSVIGYTFDKQGELLVNNPPTTCRFISVWVRYNQSHGPYVQSPSTYIGQVLYNFSHGTSGWSKKFQIQTSSSNYSLSSEQNTATGVWYHLAMGYDGSKVVAYLNGSKVWEETVSAYTSGTMRFGDDINETVSEYIGESVCRTAEEVEDYYMLTKGDYYTETPWEPNENTLAYYPLKDDTIDKTGNTSTAQGTLVKDGIGYRATSDWSSSDLSGVCNWFSFWMNVKSYASSGYLAIGAGYHSMGYYSHHNESRLNRYIYVFTSSSYAMLGKYFSPDVGERHHIGIGYDGTNSICYIDGVMYNLGAGAGFDSGRAIGIAAQDVIVSNVIAESTCWSADEVLSYYYQTRNDYVDDPWYPVKEYEVQNIYIGEYIPTTEIGIYWSEADGVISFQTSAGDGISIADKNLGATQVYNSGDNLSLANMGKGYQWGNNYGWDYGVNPVNTTTTQVNAGSYGPGNYYSSSSFYIAYNDLVSWDSSNNANLWGGTTNTYEARRGPCDEGWHIPSKDDAQTLVNAISSITGSVDVSKINQYCKLPSVTPGIGRTIGTWVNEPRGGIRYSDTYSGESGGMLYLPTSGSYVVNENSRKAEALPLRPFSNTFIQPTTSRTKLN